MPLAGPPCAIRLVGLVLASEEHCDEDLLDGTLDGDDGDNTKHGVRRIPELEEPLQGRYQDVTVVQEGVDLRRTQRTRSSLSTP